MTSFLSRIPTDLLVPLILIVVFEMALWFEAAAYYRFAGWYYRNGPAILRERWQTTADAAQIRQAVRVVLDADNLIGRESVDGFNFRQRTASVNSWTRIALRIEEAEHGAALHYEVRPFYSIAPLIIPIPWMIFGASGITGGRIMFSAAAPVFLIFAIYKWIMPWDVARIGRLRSVRRALARYGLRVCECCGYDLFGLTGGLRCPECGRDIAKDLDVC